MIKKTAFISVLFFYFVASIASAEAVKRGVFFVRGMVAERLTCRLEAWQVEPGARFRISKGRVSNRLEKYRNQKLMLFERRYQM